MAKPLRFYLLIILLLPAGFLLSLPRHNAQGQTTANTRLISGTVYDRQGQLVADAQVSLRAAGEADPLAQAHTQPDGRYALTLTGTVPDQLTVHIEREHFQPAVVPLDAEALQSLRAGQPILLPDTILQRQVTLSFWVATLIFIAMLALIAFGKLHNTLAALLGMSAVFAVSYLGRPLSEELFIFSFRGALQYVDWNVIFLIMGMMIVIAVVERTGVFQWLAFTAYRLSRGRIWLLVIILMIITGIASAALDNVTTMLLMTPITVQIALALNINPLALLMPEVLASNVAGISTLIGTPTNILIGSYAGLSFNDFLTNLTPGVLLAMLGLILYCEFVYRRELRAGGTGRVSALLLDKLAERAQITEPDHLKKAGIVGAFMLILFVAGELIHLTPAPPRLGQAGHRRDDRGRRLDHPGLLYRPVRRRRRHPGSGPHQLHRRRHRAARRQQPAAGRDCCRLVQRPLVHPHRQHPLHRRHAARHRLPHRHRARCKQQRPLLLPLRGIGHGRQRLADRRLRQHGHLRHSRAGRLPHHLCLFLQERFPGPARHRQPGHAVANLPFSGEQPGRVLTARHRTTIMTNSQPKQIICAVRGGAESRDTVSQAINLALEGSSRLTFLHIMDAEFLQYATVGPLSVVYNELVEMGTFAMMILCDRAQRRGVTDVDFVVREGSIRKQLLQFAIATRAQVLVIGHPTRSPGRNVFEASELDEFIAELEREGHLRVIQVTPSAPGRS